MSDATIEILRRLENLELALKATASIDQRGVEALRREITDVRADLASELLHEEMAEQFVEEVNRADRRDTLIFDEAGGKVGNVERNEFVDISEKFGFNTERK